VDGQRRWPGRGAGRKTPWMTWMTPLEQKMSI